MGDQARIDEFSEYAVARQSHLLRTAYLLCGDWHGAQDLTQTALLNLCKAWKRAKRADSVVVLRYWRVGAEGKALT